MAFELTGLGIPERWDVRSSIEGVPARGWQTGAIAPDAPRMFGLSIDA